MPASASAFCWVSAAARVTGVIAPIKVNGVTQTAWPNSAIVMSPSDIAASKRRGELTDRKVGPTAACVELAAVIRQH